MRCCPPPALSAASSPPSPAFPGPAVSPRTHAAPYSSSLAARLLAFSAAKLAPSPSFTSPLSSTPASAAVAASPLSASALAMGCASLPSAVRDHHASSPAIATPLSLKRRLLIARALAWAGRVSLGQTDAHTVDSILGGHLHKHSLHNHQPFSLQWSDAQSESSDDEDRVQVKEQEDHDDDQYDEDDDSWFISDSDSDFDADSDCSSHTDVDTEVGMLVHHHPAPPLSICPAHVQAAAQQGQYGLPSPPPSPPTLKRCDDASTAGVAPPTTMGLCPASTLE